MSSSRETIERLLADLLEEDVEYLLSEDGGAGTGTTITIDAGKTA